MKLKPGDRVRIRDDFSGRKRYPIAVTSSMEEYIGMTGTIREVGTSLGDHCVRITFDHNTPNGYNAVCIYHWTDEMFDLLMDRKKYDINEDEIARYTNSEFLDLLK